MSNDYSKNIEKLCEDQQEQITHMRSLIARFLNIEIHSRNNGNVIDIVLMQYNLPSHPDKPRAEAPTKLLQATKTSVDEVKRFYLEFRNDERGYADLNVTPLELAYIAVNKFNLNEIPIESEIKFYLDDDTMRNKDGTPYNPGYVYAPYVPAHFGGKQK